MSLTTAHDQAATAINDVTPSETGSVFLERAVAIGYLLVASTSMMAWLYVLALMLWDGASCCCRNDSDFQSHLLRGYSKHLRASDLFFRRSVVPTTYLFSGRRWSDCCSGSDWQIRLAERLGRLDFETGCCSAGLLPACARGPCLAAGS